MRPIPTLEEVDDAFAARIGMIGPCVGAQKLGYNRTVLAPGQRAYPLHAHPVNAERFFIVSGSGEMRIGKQRYPIRTGDVIACPPGGCGEGN